MVPRAWRWRYVWGCLKRAHPSRIKGISADSFVGVSTGVWTQSFVFTGQALYYLSHSAIPDTLLLNKLKTRVPPFSMLGQGFSWSWKTFGCNTGQSTTSFLLMGHQVSPACSNTDFPQEVWWHGQKLSVNEWPWQNDGEKKSLLLHTLLYLFRGKTYIK
jgi:hypothetical protein